jgi:pimeloyl-ACP methyl ester carboxylesterase
MNSPRTGTFVAILLNLVAASRVSAQLPAPIEMVTGNYQLPHGRMIGIDRFDMDGGQIGLLYSDYSSGVVRRLFPTAQDEFSMGPGFGVATPAELKVHFEKDQTGRAISVTLSRAHGSQVARRVPLDVRQVSFAGADAMLSGTLLLPTAKPPRAAIVLLHGSGRLTRYSFGPYPHFFTSLGLAVLVYDKRSAGSSTGSYMARTERYPGKLGLDAIAAVRFLAQWPEIDAKRIGLWGTSEGGMLATQVAAQSKDVAFAIDSSGFMMPLWQQIIFNVGAQLRADGFAPSEVSEAVNYEQLLMTVGKTGEGWAELNEVQQRARQAKWWKAYMGDFNGFSSLESVRLQWTNTYSFDPVPALHNVSCPVLGLFGTLDTSTPAAAAATNMKRSLLEGGNKDVTVRVFKRANHSLTEARTGGNDEIPTLARMVPFDVLRSWLLARLASKLN